MSTKALQTTNGPYGVSTRRLMSEGGHMSYLPRSPLTADQEIADMTGAVAPLPVLGPTLFYVLCLITDEDVVAGRGSPGEAQKRATRPVPWLSLRAAA